MTGRQKSELCFLWMWWVHSKVGTNSFLEWSAEILGYLNISICAILLYIILLIVVTCHIIIFCYSFEYLIANCMVQQHLNIDSV